MLVHGASIGELLAAQPIVARLRAAAPGLDVTYSFTSRSVRGWPGWPVGRRARLPPPLPGVTARWLDRIRPHLIVLSRGELWPAMLGAARRRGVPVAVVGGRIRAGSRRLVWPGRWLLFRHARHLAHVGAVSEADAERWRRLGAPARAVTVTGDPAVDRVLAETPDPAVVREHTAFADGEPLLVLASVEPADRPAARALLAEAPCALIVPHDPERSLRLGIPLTARQRVLGTRGQLAHVVAAAAAVFVGGWRRGRPHSHLEVEARGVVPLEGATVAALVAHWRRLRDHPAERKALGAERRAALERRAGAAAREAAALLRLLPS